MGACDRSKSMDNAKQSKCGTSRIYHERWQKVFQLREIEHTSAATNMVTPLQLDTRWELSCWLIVGFRSEVTSGVNTLSWQYQGAQIRNLLLEWVTWRQNKWKL